MADGGEQAAGKDVHEHDAAVCPADALAELQTVGAESFGTASDLESGSDPDPEPSSGSGCACRAPGWAFGVRCGSGHGVSFRTTVKKARARSRSAVRLPPSAASPINGEPTPTAVAPAAR